MIKTGGDYNQRILTRDKVWHRMAPASTPGNPLINEISALIEARTGLAADAQPHGTLHDIVISLSQGNVENYFQRLRIYKETDTVWQELIHAFTIGETYFLRDRAHFHLLRAHILPNLIDHHARERKLNICSVGCATGEEAYSLAITIAEILPEYADWDINIVGLDLNIHALNAARHGIYRKWAFRHTDDEFQDRYFDEVPTGLQIKPEIQRMVQFRHGNLFTGAVSHDNDLVLCRNVLIYFSREYTRRAEMVLYDSLNSGGWLLLGHAEMIRHKRDDWIANQFPGSPIYQKPTQTTTPTIDRIDYKRQTLTQTVVVPSKERPGNSRVDTLYDNAVIALQSEAYEQAAQFVRELLELDPEHAAGHTLMSCIYANRNDHLAAHAQIDTALYNDPLLADAYYLRATLHLDQNCTTEAFTALRAVLYCQRNHPLACFLLGNLYAQAGDPLRARRYWENAQGAIQSLKGDSPLADISPVTAGQLNSLVSEQLQGWH